MTTGIKPNSVDSIQTAMAFSPHDWGSHHRLAWIYGIVMGWDDVLPEIAQRHGWDVDTVIRLKNLHTEFKNLQVPKSNQ